ncbi:helix-turn-helix domain-containing protein [Zongyangia hominis]|uniref:Helix-turn-helix transcriptional regulator n=1 Tax=Zongyangia hominis TaxID=2763677 RepID=A0A926IB34_9FIRM|nr:helix-turn-helix transcriptional regulator [Zongyangia hominis]MBC8569868.1 helix-turn-helix transcriptional regulator [Zongyangia hominis]
MEDFELAWGIGQVSADDLKYYFGMRVSDFRRLNGLTQQQLAQKLSVSTSFICKVEQGKKIPTLSHCLDLARCLGVHLNWLFFDISSCSTKPPSELLRLARMARSRRMSVMNQLDKKANACWPTVGKTIENIYGRLMDEPWESPYWKVFAFFFVFEQIR